MTMKRKNQLMVKFEEEDPSAIEEYSQSKMKH